MTRWRRGRWLLAGVPLLACSELPSGATTPFALSFDALPAPSIVLGDTLRDSTGVPTRPVVIVFNPDGEVIPTAQVEFLLVDTATLVRIGSTGLLISTGTRVGTTRVVATVNGLQSEPRVVNVVERPDTTLAASVPDTLRYSFSDTTQNFSSPLQVRVLHRDGTTLTGVGQYLVRFALEDAADTAVAVLLNDQRRRLGSDPTGRTHIDTTGTDGVASRLIYLRPSEQLARPVDSIVVIATVRYRTGQLAGSPVRVVLPVTPRVTP